MSEWKKTCGNCAGRVESIIYKDRCDITEEVIEDMSATCDDWEPNNEVLREMQDDELKALRKKCDAALAQVAVLRGALSADLRVFKNLNRYLFNYDEAIKRVENALSTTPAEAVERVNGLVEALEWIEKTTQDTGAQDAASDALADWRRGHDDT